MTECLPPRSWFRRTILRQDGHEWENGYGLTARGPAVPAEAIMAITRRHGSPVIISQCGGCRRAREQACEY